MNGVQNIYASQGFSLSEPQIEADFTDTNSLQQKPRIRAIENPIGSVSSGGIRRLDELQGAEEQPQAKKARLNSDASIKPEFEMSSSAMYMACEKLQKTEKPENQNLLSDPPMELQYEILSFVDIPSIGRFRASHPKVRDMINALPEGLIKQINTNDPSTNLLYHNKKNDLLAFLGDPDDSENGMTVLMRAAFEGERDVVVSLLEKSDIDATQSDREGQTALMWAVIGGNTEIIPLILNLNGIDVNQPDTFSGFTPLIWAARGGESDVVSLLLANHAVNVNQADRAGATALIWAASEDHADTVDMLLSSGNVNVNQTDPDGRTALWIAADQGNTSVVIKLLSANGVDLNHVDNHGDTPLMCAARKGHNDVVNLLRDAGAVDNRNFISRVFAWIRG